MATYHLSVKIISRGKGKSAVAAAAYRAGELIKNEYDGITHDYTKKGGVVHTEILLPENAPAEFSGRAVLWNAVEKIEKVANSQLAREIELALPVELSKGQNISLVCGYVKEHFVSAGMCADVCVHDVGKGNPHAHVLLTMRPFNDDKSWGIKEKKDYALDGNGNRIPIIDKNTGLQKLDGRNRKQWKREYVQTNDWNNPYNAEIWRAAWEAAANAALGKHGHESRIDHRSYERQGKEQIPTVHMGVAATQMERKGIPTERGNQNREIAKTNHLLFMILAKLKQLKDRLKEAVTPIAPPTLADVLQSFLNGGELHKAFGQIRNPKAVERVLTFMQKNNISTMPELREKYTEGLKIYNNAHDNLKYYDGRIKTLDENIRQGAVYWEHKDIYDVYKGLKPRKQPKFFEENRAELMLFEAAKRYLDEHYIKPGFSVSNWKNERAGIAAERGKAYREYNALKGMARETDTVRLEAEKIVRELGRPQQHRRETRDRGM